jgi:hypothetical protein
MPEASTNKHPKNRIETTVAATERTTAADAQDQHTSPECQKPPPVLDDFVGNLDLYLDIAEVHIHLLLSGPQPVGGRSAFFKPLF